MKRYSLFFSVLVFVGTVIQAQVPIEFQQGLGGYDGTSDTSYQTGDPLDIWGDLAEFEWDGSDEGGFNFGMLRFDNIFGTGPGQVPPDAVIINAFLTLNVTNEGGSDQIATMHNLLFPFDESLDFFEFGDGAGFDPRPGIDYEEEILNSIPGPSAGDVLELDVTSSLQAWQSGQENHGWVFIPGGSNGVGIASSEASNNQPKLTVVIEGASPPSAVRSIPSGFVSAGGTVNVSLVVTQGGSGGNISVVETLPVGWTASDISNGGSFASGAVSWTLNNPTGNTTLTYSVTTSASPDKKSTISGSLNNQYIISGDSVIEILEPVGIFENHLDVGNPAAEGSASFDNGTYTVSGSGNDIWGSADNFHFAYRAVSGDVNLIATVDLDVGTSSSTWAKAGPMVRNNLTAGSAFGFAMIRSNGQDYAPQWRDSQAAGGAWEGDSTIVGGKENNNAQQGKVEIERIGNEINFYYYDPNTDERVFWWVHDVPEMDDPVYVGLAVTAHEDGSLSTGIFTDVSLMVNGNPVDSPPAEVSTWELY